MLPGAEFRKQLAELVKEQNQINLRRGSPDRFLNDAQISAYALVMEKGAPTGHTISFSPESVFAYDKLLPSFLRMEFSEMYSNPIFPDVVYISQAYRRHPNLVANFASKLESRAEDTLSHESVHQALFRIEELKAGLTWDNYLVTREIAEDDFLIRTGIREAPEGTDPRSLGKIWDTG